MSLWSSRTTPCPSMASRASQTVTSATPRRASLPTSLRCARRAGSAVTLCHGVSSCACCGQQTIAHTANVQAKIEHTLGWAARHRMPVEVVRLEDVQPPSEQLVLVRRLAAKYDLPLAHARADAGGASDAAVSSSSSSSRGALVPQPLRLWSWSHHAAQQRQATRSRRDLDERAPAAVHLRNGSADTRVDPIMDEHGDAQAVLEDARAWRQQGPFDVDAHRAE